MSWRADRDVLLDAVTTVAPAVGGAHMAVLNGVRLEVAGGQLAVTGTDLELTITTACPVNAEQDGTLILPAKLLRDWLAKAPDGAVELAVDDKTSMVTVTAGTSAITLHSYPTDEWPTAPIVDGEHHTIDAQQWAQVKRIIPMASTDRFRPSINVVRFDQDGAWATDGYRLGWVKFAWPGEPINVPCASMVAVARAADDTVELAASDRHARFTSGPTTWTCRLSEAQFPNAKQLVPTDDQPVRFEADRDDLVAALARLALIDGKTLVPAVFELDDDQVTVTANMVDVANVVEHVDAQTTGSIKVAFNPLYLTSIFKAVDDPRPLMKGTDQLKPWVCEDDGLLALLMPSRVPV